MFNKKGFTLIEFIIVMAIIGILVLMAAPKFMNYVDRAHDSRLMNDMKVVQNTAQAIHADYLAGVSKVDAAVEGDGEDKQVYDISLKTKETKNVKKIEDVVFKKVNLNKEEIKGELFVDDDFNVYTTIEPKSKTE